MYEEVRYKAFKEKFLDDIKVDIKQHITELEINEKFPRNDSTMLSEAHNQKWYDTRIKSLSKELTRKDDIIYMSKNVHNIVCKVSLVKLSYHGSLKIQIKVLQF